MFFIAHRTHKKIKRYENSQPYLLFHYMRILDYQMYPHHNNLPI